MCMYQLKSSIAFYIIYRFTQPHQVKTHPPDPSIHSSLTTPCSQLIIILIFFLLLLLLFCSLDVYSTLFLLYKKMSPVESKLTPLNVMYLWNSCMVMELMILVWSNLAGKVQIENRKNSVVRNDFVVNINDNWGTSVENLKHIKTYFWEHNSCRSF